MIKRHAFSLLTFMGYCFLASSSFAMEIETGSEKEQTSLKNETNSNSIDTKFCLTGQEESHPLEQHYVLWIDNLKTRQDEKEEKLNEADLTSAFVESFDPRLYRDPITVDGLTFYIPHGMTPTKTPRRCDNFESLHKGKPGVFVDPRTDQVVRKELHHLQQNPLNGAIVLLPRSVHKDNHGILHPFKVSRINDNEWARIKYAFYKLLEKQMQHDLEMNKENQSSNTNKKRKEDGDGLSVVNTKKSKRTELMSPMKFPEGVKMASS